MKKNLFTVVLLLLVCSGCKHLSPDEKLYSLAKKKLIENLKRPDGITFDDKKKPTIFTKYADGFSLAVVYGIYKGSNSFGVNEMNSFQIWIHSIELDSLVKNPEKWDVVFLKIEGDTVINEIAKGIPVGPVSHK